MILPLRDHLPCIDLALSESSSKHILDGLLDPTDWFTQETRQLTSNSLGRTESSWRRIHSEPHERSKRTPGLDRLVSVSFDNRPAASNYHTEMEKSALDRKVSRDVQTSKECS